MRKLFLQTAGLFLFAILVYFIHAYIITPQFQEVSERFINFNYGFNLGLSLFYLVILYVLYTADSNFLGFIFLLLSGLKLMIYLFLIHTLEFTIGRERFLHFFLPYLLGLGVELFFVYRLLNKARH